ncbi:hypothetical protein ACE6H2_010099 [Prunus campanulata]
MAISSTTACQLINLKGLNYNAKHEFSRCVQVMEVSTKALQSHPFIASLVSNLPIQRLKHNNYKEKDMCRHPIRPHVINGENNMGDILRGN